MCFLLSHHGYCGRDPSLLSGEGESLWWGCYPCIWGDNGILSLYSLVTGHLTFLPVPQLKIAPGAADILRGQCLCWGATGSVPLPQFDDCAEFHLMKEWVLPKTFSFGRKVILPNLSLKLIRDLSRDVPWARGDSRRCDRVYWPPPPSHLESRFSCSVWIISFQSQRKHIFFFTHQVTCWSK